MSATAPRYLHRCQACLESVAASLWPWCLLALASAVALAFAFGTPDLIDQLGDPDDATRLTQVREFLAGASWFDTTLPRFGSPEPLLSHWSRLIDLPIAALIGLFQLFLSRETAELLVRAVWPLILFTPMLYVLARAGEHRGGRAGAYCVLILAVLSFAAMVQFRMGRIDHHNAQSLAAVTGVLLLAGAFTSARLGTYAGFALGLGIAIGYEAILVTGVALAFAVIMAAWSGRGADGIKRAALAFALTIAVAFLLTTPPSRWLDVRCDAISLNMVLLAGVAGTSVFAVLDRSEHWTRLLRLAVLSVAGILAIGLYVLSEPACMAGPFGQVDPGVFPIWLGHVSETRSMAWLFENAPAVAIANLLHIGAGLAAALFIAKADRDDGAIFYAGAFAITAIICVLQLKLISYAALLAVVPLGVGIARLPALSEVSALTTRAAAVALLNQNTLLLAGALLTPAGNDAAAKLGKETLSREQCFSARSLAPLADLEKGLAVSEVTMGPFLVALTPLNVLAAPYHRLDKAILENHAILSGPAQDAERRLRSVGARYVVTCSTYPLREHEKGTGDRSLRFQLLAGRPPAFLQDVPLGQDTPLRVWRLRAP